MSLATYNRLHVKVHVSNRVVIRAAHKRLAPGARRNHIFRKDRHAWLREMLAHHAAAQAMVARYRL